MRRISWITPEYFLDVDLPVIKYLKGIYTIKLIVVLSGNKKNNYKVYINNFIQGSEHVQVEYFYLNERMRSLGNIIKYYKIIESAKNFSPNVYYISFQGIPYAIFMYKAMLPLKVCIAACHNVETPHGAKNEKLAKIYTNLLVHVFKNIQVFSKGQFYVLNSKTKNKNILLAPLMIKDYGVPTICRSGKSITFLFFGNILPYKRVDILINAANILYEKGHRNFKVIIAGNCKDWDRYQKLIKYPELFDLTIKHIPNEDVANIFAISDFFVMPYQDIAQSGAITVAYRYNLPTILSNISQFDDYYIKEKSGLSFESGNPFKLAIEMKKCIQMPFLQYSQMKINQINFVKQNFADDLIVKKYREFIDKLNDLN